MFPEEDMGMDDDMGMDEPSMNPMESRLKAMEEELFAMRAAAKAASLPAWPPPTTITSNISFNAPPSN